MRRRGPLRLGLEVRDDLLAKQADGVEDLLVLRGPNGTQQEDFLHPQRFVPFEKPDALRANWAKRLFTSVRK